MRASLGGSTKVKQEVAVNIEMKDRGPWLNLGDEGAVVCSTSWPAQVCRHFSFDNESSIGRGYLASIKFFHKLYVRWELPTSR